MLAAKDIEYLADRRAILDQMEAIKRERDYYIRMMLDDGCGVAEIVAVTGLTRARIYQIRDGGAKRDGA